MVFVNVVGADGAELPFGGVKRSGFGRELGRYGDRRVRQQEADPRRRLRLPSTRLGAAPFGDRAADHPGVPWGIVPRGTPVVARSHRDGARRPRLIRGAAVRVRVRDARGRSPDRDAAVAKCAHIGLDSRAMRGGGPGGDERGTTGRGAVQRPRRLDAVDTGIIEGAVQRDVASRSVGRRPGRGLRGDGARPLRAPPRRRHPPGHRGDQPARARLRRPGDDRHPHRRPPDRGRRRASRAGPRRSTSCSPPASSTSSSRLPVRRPASAARADEPHPIARRRPLDRDVPVPGAVEAALRLGCPARSGRGGACVTTTTGASPDVRLVEVVKAFDDVRAVDGISRRDPERLLLRAARPVGLRQDDDAADDRRLRGARPAGQILLGDRDVVGLPAVQARRQHRVPELRALPAHDDLRQRRLRARAEGRRQGASAGPACARCSSSSTWPDVGTASRSSSPAGSSSASRSPGRSSTTRACSCSTSRWAPSTSSCASRCSSS